jgi:HSP20 family protein
MAETTVPQPGSDGNLTREPTHSEESFISPAVDIYEDEQGLHVTADLPGVEPGGTDIRVDRGVLTIQARAQHLMDSQPVHREYALTGYFRQFQLPEEVDANRIAAELKHGVLHLQLPRVERAQPRRIEVRSA